MLVLTRKVGQVVHIEGGIKVTILKMKNGQVRIGFDAPKGVSIMRGEALKLEAELTAFVGE